MIWILGLLVGVIVELASSPSMLMYELITLIGIGLALLGAALTIILAWKDYDNDAIIGGIITIAVLGFGAVWILIAIGGLLTKLIMGMI
jgi:hypothetical protein